MTRNLKKLICLLLAVTLFCVASAMVFAEISKSTDEPSATPVDESAGRIDTPAEDIEVQSAPIKVKPASIMEVSPFSKDVKVCSLNKMDEPARITLLCTYGMLSSLFIPAPHWFDIPDNYIAGFVDMLADMEFIPVSGDEMAAEAETVLSSKEVKTVPLMFYSEEGDVMLDVTFYRSAEDAVWAPYIRIYEPFEGKDTHNGIVRTESCLYKINPETMDAQILETVTTMALGGSLDEYIDFVDEFLNGNMKVTGNDGNSKYGYYSYYMERFPYANIVY